MFVGTSVNFFMKLSNMVGGISFSFNYILPVAETQFFRVLWENLGIKLTPEQQQILAGKYRLKKNGQVNYRLFCDVISQPFDPNNVWVDPNSQKVETSEL